MTRKPKAVAEPVLPLTLYDINTCAPDFFGIHVGRSSVDAVEFVRRAEAFYQTMFSLNRAVMLCYDADGRHLYLASVPEIVSPETTP